MKAFIIFILISSVCLVFGYVKKCKHSKNMFCCVKYVKNYDGDTITVNVKNIHPLFGMPMTVRLAGIDTPELRTKNKCEKQKAVLARDLVKNLLIKADRIDIVNAGKGKYFRVVADIIIDNSINLKNVLLEKGLAYKYDGAKKQKIDWCKNQVK
jgi:endonuclease YncB( thermonuclease family)